MNKITWLQADGWQAIYFNGAVLDQGHSVNFDSVMAELAKIFDFQFEDHWAQDWIDNNGGGWFPEDINVEPVTPDA